MVVMRIQPIRSWKYCRKSPFEATIVELCSSQTRFSLIDDLIVVVLDRSKLMMSQAVDGTWAVAAVQRRTR